MTSLRKPLVTPHSSGKAGGIGALVHLGLARAYTLQGDAARARAAYNDFLTLWNDADPDIPSLKEANAEYAKLPQ